MGNDGDDDFELALRNHLREERMLHGLPPTEPDRPRWWQSVVANDHDDAQIDIRELLPLTCRGNGHHNWSLTKDRCECGELVGDDRALDDVMMPRATDDAS